MAGKENLREELMKKKKTLEAQKKSIEKYMGPHEHDESLEKEWERINQELEQIEKQVLFQKVWVEKMKYEQMIK
ncbi:hypothetical protein [Petrotoga sp. DB-2]